MLIILSETNMFSGSEEFHIDDVVYPVTRRLGPRVQRNVQMVVVEAGEIDVTLDGERLQLRGGQGVILRPGRVEEFRFAGGTRHSWCEAVGADGGAGA